jgi:HAD superfamily hydrolase (TIGR01509 family)
MDAQQGLLFDLDGTLVDTLWANYNAYNCALGEYELSISWEAFQRTNGQDSYVFLQNFFPELSKQEIDTVRKQKAEIYSKFLDTTVPNIELIKLLEHKGNSKTGLVTNAKARAVQSVLKYHALDSYFDILVTGDMVDNPKPNPEPYHLAKRMLAIPSEQILVYEDSIDGYLSATRAGLSVIMIKDFR